MIGDGYGDMVVFAFVLFVLLLCLCHSLQYYNSYNTSASSCPLLHPPLHPCLHPQVISLGFHFGAKWVLFGCCTPLRQSSVRHFPMCHCMHTHIRNITHITHITHTTTSTTSTRHTNRLIVSIFILTQMSPTAEQIAWLFVSQYFKRLHSDPSELHHFYDVDAKVLHGKEQDDAAAVSGTESIQERIGQLHTQGCKTLISCLDAMEGPNKSILIQIIGQMSSTDDGVPQKFVQSVVLESKSGTNYSIYSDVFRFLKDDEETKEEETKEVKEKEEPKEVKEVKEEKKEAVKEAAPVAPAPTPVPEAPKEAPKEKEPKEAPKEVKEAPVAPAAAPVAPAAPAAAAASPVAPAAAAAPATGPISWAARARSSDKPGAAPAADAPVPVVVPAKKEASSSPIVAAATPASTARKSGGSSGSGMFHSAYIKGVDGATDMGAVEGALNKIGNGIVHFEVTKSKNGVFVDFADAASLRKALEQREIKVGDVTIVIDERKRRKTTSGSGSGSGSGNGGSGSGAGGSANNRDSNKRQGTKRR